jgi:hypothetical protein
VVYREHLEKRARAQAVEKSGRGHRPLENSEKQTEEMEERMTEPERRK